MPTVLVSSAALLPSSLSSLDPEVAVPFPESEAGSLFHVPAYRLRYSVPTSTTSDQVTLETLSSLKIYVAHSPLSVRGDSSWFVTRVEGSYSLSNTPI